MAADASSPQPTLSEQDVNVLLAQLGTAELSSEQKDHVRRALEAKKVESNTGNRKAMQDFCMLSLYLGEEHWEKIMNYSEESSAVLGMIISFLCQTYGLRCPSEQTQACLTALLVARDMKKAGTGEIPPAGQLRALFLTVKARVQGQISKFKGQPQPPGCEYRKILPSDPAVLPACWQAVSHTIASPRIPLTEILQSTRHIQLRDRASSSTTPQLPALGDVQQMIGMFAASFLAQTMANKPAANITYLADLEKPQSNLRQLLDRTKSMSSESLAPALPPAPSPQLAIVS